MLTIENLEMRFPEGNYGLKGIDLKVEKGEFIVLLGLSGSGKSTLLRSINRLIEPTGGSINYNSLDVLNLKSNELRKYRKKIGMIFQQFNLINNLSSIKNVLTGALGSRSGFKSLVWSISDRIKAEDCLKRVGLEKQKLQKAGKLSGGQQQRVAIARVLMQNPELILADEPVASLDPATADSVMKYLGDINSSEGKTVICSLHFLSLARKYGTRVVALKDGKVRFDGKPDQITDEVFRNIYGEDAAKVEIR